MNYKMKLSEAMEMIKESEAGLSKEELQEMIEEGKTIEVNCHFCNKNIY